MAKFAYRMQNILDIKLKLEEQEKANFAVANSKVLEEQQKLSELLRRQASYEDELKEAQMGSIDINHIKICKQSINSMKSLIRNQMIELNKAQRNLERVRAKLNEVMIERKTQEALKEKAFEEFKQELLKQEAKEIDELVSYKFGNNIN